MKRYFLMGLLIWVPIVITLWVLHLIVGTLDQSLQLLPVEWRPEAVWGHKIPGIGMILTLVVILLTGLFTANFVGQKVLQWLERAVQHIPVVKSIYSSVKQVSDTLLSSNGQAFRKALLIQYPHAGAWTVAFQTGKPSTEIATHFGEEHISVFLPTTPNPTSGFFLMVPLSATKELNLSVDEALKYIVSMGVVAPNAVASTIVLDSAISSTSTVQPKHHS